MKKQDIDNRVNEIKSQLDNMVKGINMNAQDLDQNDHEALAKYRNEILSARNAFDTKKYFVVCLGAAKAGKSTLLNALAEREVSHASPSAEMTLHCSIIMAADAEHPEGITLYSLRNSNVNNSNQDKDIEEHTRLLLEYFKGTKEWDDINQTFSKSTHTYTLGGNEASKTDVNNLQYILTSHDLSKIQPDDNFFLAEIRVNTPNAQNILNYDVALIDMPGLDGITAGKDKNPILDCLPKFCHQFLLLQSSVTALNSVTQAVLMKTLALKPSAPLWVVYNEIRGKAEWHKPAALDAARELEIKRAKEELKRLTHDMQNGVKTFNVNAVMAWESCKEEYARHLDDFKEKMTPEVLQDNSRIETLKLALREQVDTQRQTTILQGALDDCINLNIPFQKDRDFARQIQELKDEITALETTEKAWQKCIKALRETCTNYRQNKKSDITCLLDNEFKIELKKENPKTHLPLLNTLKRISIDFRYPAAKGENASYDSVEQQQLIDAYLSRFTDEVTNTLAESPFVVMAKRKIKGYVERQDDSQEIQHQGMLDDLKRVFYTDIDKVPQVDGTCLKNAISNFLDDISMDEITLGNFSYPTIEEYFNASGKKYEIPAQTAWEKLKCWSSSRCENSINEHFQGMKMEYLFYLEHELQGNICEKFVNSVVDKYLNRLSELPGKLDEVFQQWQMVFFATRYQYCQNLNALLEGLQKSTTSLKTACERLKFDQKQ